MSIKHLSPDIVQQLSLIVASKTTSDSNIEDVSKNVLETYLKSIEILESTYYRENNFDENNFLRVNYY